MTAQRSPARLVDDALLRDWPLPQPDAASDKEDRGDVLVVAGSRETPGAALLAATAALRAGAGKLCIASARSVAVPMAVALPEARVIGLPESGEGGLCAAEGVAALRRMLERSGVVLLGPGWIDEASSVEFVQRARALVQPGSCVVLDAMAMSAAPDGLAWPGPLLLTPHAGEMAHLCGVSKDAVIEHAEAMARDAAARWNGIVVLKGATTVIASPDGRAWRHEGGNPGLATSGSGDVLAGVIAGLAARGADPAQAAVWGVALHARAGGVLAQRRGAVGYLAGELAAEIPALMLALAGPATTRS